MGRAATSKLWGLRFDPELELLFCISVYVLLSGVSSLFSRILLPTKDMTVGALIGWITASHLVFPVYAPDSL